MASNNFNHPALSDATVLSTVATIPEQLGSLAAQHSATHALDVSDHLGYPTFSDVTSLARSDRPEAQLLRHSS